ncbi:polyketide synthase [Bacillus velezensis]|uniref:SDR family NAD(P)-dependent oxidoreductase n=3 Tax=Bacillus amyloliquefaciens group TaxID=1938374 RepID=UPI00080C6758|nr:SDR family NAD(P)-dependent oxidoreductase [Bacillus velezensis]ANU30635.1 polyketide synthase [Bacillus velezensis]
MGKGDKQKDRTQLSLRTEISNQMKELNRLLLQVLRVTLRSMGLTGEAPAASCLPLYERWLEESIRLLDSDFKSDETAAVWEEWHKKKNEWLKDPDMKAQALLADTVIQALPDILTGKIKATDVMFPDSSMELVEGIYKHNILADYYNDVLANEACIYVENVIKNNPEANIRLLEIGAGTGGTSSTLFKKLRPYQNHIQEYCYTDLSKAFLMHAEKEYGADNPYLTYQLFNVEQPAAGQGLHLRTYDIAIAANVLHATKNIRKTLRTAKAVLKKDGLLLVNELGGHTPFTHVTFGLLEGWWLYEDEALRIPGCPGLYPETWKSVLMAEGFHSIQFPAENERLHTQQIITAKSNGVIRQSRKAYTAQKRQSNVPQTSSDRQLPIKQAGEGLSEKTAAFLIRAAAKVLKMPAEEINPLAPLDEYGIDSILIVQLTNELRDLVPDISSTLFFEYRTIEELAAYLAETKERELHARFSEEVRHTEAASSGSLLEKSTDYLKQIVSAILKMPIEDVQAHTPLEEYGIDSILIVQLTNRVREDIPDLSSTLFFEYPTIGGLAEYLVSSRQDDMAGIFKTNKEAEKAPHTLQKKQSRKKSAGLTKRQAASLSEKAPPASEPPSKHLEVAIVGLAGRYPGAENVNEFWERLKTGEHGITEIPKDRWDWRDYYDETKGKEGRMYTKWGGFLSDIDKFDPLFFKISPKEAERMDPQERLFLETAYAALEDAGYTPDSLCAGKKVGVFAGVMNGNYPTGAHYHFIPNRVSYVFDFHGPSIAVDTACSSSLTAIHLAAESIRTGASECAIAGGVNLITDPVHYIGLSSMRMLSPSNACKAFGDKADGFVDGEGVGCIVLKPLNKAVEDHDHIYGVIKGSALNAGGKTNGFTVPNPNAQGEVIAEAMERAGIDPRAISYLEAHGTGTSLGDPIEIAGLTKAFRRYTDAKQFCSIGSVKSNIGHLESAAGIAAVTKILLQMKHGYLVPSLHSKQLNPEIDFETSPFIVQQKTAEWRRPVIESEGVTREYPRIAGTSSFGAGGANAHLLIEEYEPAEMSSADTGRPALFVLSAKDKDRLRERALLLADTAGNGTITDANLLDAAFTLQVGRVPMEERLAMAADSVSELEQKLTAFLNNVGSVSGVFTGRGDSAVTETEGTVSDWTEKRQFNSLLNAWVHGTPVDWLSLYKGVLPHRISLPSYPFAKESYWMKREEPKTGTTEYVHPFLHENTSTLAEQSYHTSFTGREHVFQNVRGERVLSAAVYLEMALAAYHHAADSSEEKEIWIRTAAWTDPITGGHHGAGVNLSLLSEDEEGIYYEIYSDEEKLHHYGIIGQGNIQPSRVLDIASLQKDCRPLSFDYETPGTSGVTISKEFRTVEKLYAGENAVWAKLALTDESGRNPGYHLPPEFVDAAFHVLAKTEPSVHIVPEAVEELRVMRPCSSGMWMYINKKNQTGCDIQFCDETGTVCAEIKGIRMRHPSQQDHGQEEQSEMMIFEEMWTRQPLKKSIHEELKTVICFLTGEAARKHAYQSLRSLYPGAGVFFISQGEETQKLSNTHYQIKITDGQAYQETFRHIETAAGKADAILYGWPLEDEKAVKDYSILYYVIRAAASLRFKPRRILLSAQCGTDTDISYAESWIGLERSLKLILPETDTAAVYFGQKGPLEKLIHNVCEELHSESFRSVMYSGEIRHVMEMKQTDIASVEKRVIKSGKTYLITGGCGGLGLLFAGYFAEKGPVTLILTGRSAAGGPVLNKIKRLEESGAKVFYVQADAADQAQMEKGLQEAKEKGCGPIHGVIHAAGLQGTESILEKDLQTFQQVLSPKADGTAVLDQVLSREPLDFFCCFSSSSAILGDFGSCDYAMGNRFQMAFVRHREKLVSLGLRSGKSLAINWPLWKEGGMHVGTAESTDMYLKSSGQRYLYTEEGLDAFETLLVQPSSQYLVLAGFPSRAKRFLQIDQGERPISGSVNRNVPFSGRRSEMKGFTLEECVSWDVKELAARLLKIDKNRLTDADNLADFGFDSISLAEFASSLSAHYGIEVTPALFFGHSTLEKVVRYFLTEHKSVMEHVYEEKKPESAEQSVFEKAGTEKRKKQRGRNKLNAGTEGSQAADSIAIIGMSGRFPQARTADELWDILFQEKDVVAPVAKKGFTSSKWKLGAVPGADEFDPLFFEISPREAETMDPKQRLLLQEAWRALEDAGYGASHIRQQTIGMFVGAEEGDYHLLTRDKGNVTSHHNGILAARLAYHLNLSGPVMAINTACSSGLVSVHQAVLSLQNKECTTAVAAGVNIMNTPDFFETIDKAGMLSENGKCFAFDKRADGMVPGEAAAAVVLKPLREAEADGDPIYGVIRASGINYDGKTNGITAPSGVAQTRLLTSVYDRGRINPEDIEYIVTHGTGTKLGDPVEINALYDAFSAYTNEEAFCALTSIKTNIGHTFAASGIVSLISLLQAFSREMIPASLHCSGENRYINWEKSPFYVNKTGKPWPSLPGKNRMGAVSAFGMSGTNAHVVMESYKRSASPHRDAPAYLLTLSAKTEEALHEKIEDMITWAENGGLKENDLAQLSYTLLKGRHHFNHRAAIVVQDADDAVYVWKQAKLNEHHPYVFSGKVPQHFAGRQHIQEHIIEVLGKCSASYSDHRKYQELLCVLADFYCQGYEIEGDLLYGGPLPRIGNLPGYPFARQTYWASDRLQRELESRNSAEREKLHPLLHTNTSTFTAQRFTSVFSGHEPFFADHIVNGKPVLPGAAALEMARAAVTLAAEDLPGGKAGVRLKQIVWLRPVTALSEGVTLHVRLQPEENGDIAFEAYAEGEEPLVFFQGKAVLEETERAPVLDVEAVQARCGGSHLSKAECYEAFDSLGITYGPSHQALDAVYAGSGEVLAKLTLPPSAREEKEPFTLHPSMLDAALQASIGLVLSDGSASGRPFLPFALQDMQVFSACRETMWAVLSSKDGAYHIELCDENGAVCVRLTGLTARFLEEETEEKPLLLQPKWQESPPGEGGGQEESFRYVTLYGGMNAEDISGAVCAADGEGPIEDRYDACAAELSAIVKRLIKEKQKKKTLIQLLVPDRGEDNVLAGLAAFLKTAHLEHPKLYGQVIQADPDESASSLLAKLKENRAHPEQAEIRYEDGKRLVRNWRHLPASQSGAVPWKDEGVYLLTGGAGGIGLIFAEEIASRVKNAVLVLTGRAEALDEERSARLRRLEASGARVLYQPVDVTDRAAVIALVRGIQEEHGTLDGIIHGAGVIADNYILNQTENERKAVMAPKVKGLINLDEAAKDVRLDFFILFSSLAGGMGNPGQSGYAAANAFMDVYAARRNRLVRDNERSGQTLSVNWPLWEEGGMRVDKETERLMYEQTGMKAMRSASGIQALYAAFASGEHQVMVAEGDEKRIRSHIFDLGEEQSAAGQAPAVADARDLKDQVQEKLKRHVSDLLKVSMKDIEADSELTEYGFDSIIFTEFTNLLNRTYQLELSPTIFFEFPTLRKLSGHLISEWKEAFSGLERESLKTAPKAGIRKAEAPAAVHVKRETPVSVKGKSEEKTEPIAIIGISGIFPQAKDIDEFWTRLQKGEHCITEIPRDRWDWREYYGDPAADANKTSIKWGGFIDGIAGFDPLFFGISPKEAEMMDPQQRLLMMYVWKAIEDAGYSAKRIAGTKTGIFTGTLGSGYQTLINKAGLPVEGYTMTGIVPSVGPNRMSYFLDIHGPSEPVETACSSSLVAIHRAVKAIETGDCDMAVAGGVNTIVTPEGHIGFQKAGMLSEDGRCKTFSDQADGYVRGEGAGMIVLKKLSEAEHDRDHIYGLIRGTAENHGGRSASLTAPNPQAQTDVLKSAYQKAGIHPSTITYIEAHGTGTALGDPIEINALKKAFQTDGAPGGYCGIGSVKTNIGHLELAAGIAGVIKVLMQLKHRTLAKSLHCENINPHIKLKDSPFYIVTETKEWEALRDENGRVLPRRAGVSSFGFGGVNAHIVIEEYMGRSETEQQETREKASSLFVLSAKNEERLKERARLLRDFIQNGSSRHIDLADAAYTLQTGRDAMEARLGIIAGSAEELTEKLNAFLLGKNSEDIISGRKKRENNTISMFSDDEDAADLVSAWLEKKKYRKVLRLWANGFDTDWEQLYTDSKPRRISLPSYPFRADRYWVPKREQLPLSNQKTVVLQKTWEPCEAVSSSEPFNSKIALIVSEDTKDLAAEVKKQLNDADIVQENQLISFLQDPNAAIYSGFIDFTGCGSRQKRQDISWVASLQQLIEYGRGQENIKMLYLTKGLESFKNKAAAMHGIEKAGLYRMLRHEYSHILTCHADIDPEEPLEQTAAFIKQEIESDLTESAVCCRDGMRFSYVLRQTDQIEPEAVQTDRTAFPKDAVLMITGGTRGLGALCAKHFVSAYGVKKLLLTGRKELPPKTEWDIEQTDPVVSEKIQLIRQLESQGVEVCVSAVDLTDKQAVGRLIKEVTSTLGPVGGILHCAGIADRENPAFLRKSKDSIARVLAPKADGLHSLYESVKDDAPAFFVLFSSVSAAVPILAAGQSDYAMANSYMDYFAENNESDIISIQWPAWDETGMSKDIKSGIYEQTGLLRHSDAEGLKMLDYILRERPGAVVLPAQVKHDWDIKALENAKPAAHKGMKAASKPPETKKREHNRIDIQSWLKSLLAKELSIDETHMDIDVPFQEYGMDSIFLAQVLTKIDQKLPSVSIDPTVLLEHPTIEQLADYLAAHCPEAFSADAAVSAEKVPLQKTPKRSKKTADKPEKRGKVAIIGMACHFPKAGDIKEFWKNLRSGTDAVTEVPPDRWDTGEHYQPGEYQEGKSISKWGGFIHDIDQFDPEYFNISETLAPMIDPLQRQWLEVSAEALADAGYQKEDLWGRRIGVFAGARAGAFHQKFQYLQKDAIIGAGQNFITAHMAHIYNFTGPNLVVDTACSSSLTAIHLAVQAIQNGEAEAAFAGGVDILLDEKPFLTMSAARILSPNGRSKSFDADADGTGIGEGCGVLMLKPLEKAIEDEDKIYGVIDGSAINNDGSTMGVTTPNPRAQQDLIEQAVQSAEIEPDTMTYVETHGTGTLIGDPIELKGLTNVLSAYSDEKQFCGVGSVKSNIGHLLSAAGAAGIIKVLLAIANEELPPTLHCHKPNPRFQFNDSPLYPVLELKRWDGKKEILRAGVSAFGLGGNNAHIIVSNEGIPKERKATMEPKAGQTVYRKQRYWPEKAQLPEAEENEAGTEAMFEISEV